ncbi:MAG: M50 family metallopeptidase [Hyphomicrobiaceae bacterium]
MLGKAITLFEIFGFKVRIDISWAFLAMLIAWSLSQGYFPEFYKGFPTTTYWWMGLGGMLGLFASILLHEMAHSVVAKAFGMEIRSITLWLLGGVAEMEDEPPTPIAEFLMAIAGPLMSLALAGALFLISTSIASVQSLEPLYAVLQYLVFLNIIVTVFNLVPAFPMDGGRILRAVLWAVKKDFHWATRIAAKAGSLFGVFLIVVGILDIVWTGDLRGLWWIILGMFVRFAADASYQRVHVDRMLAGQTVGRVMARDPVSVPSDITIRRFIDDWIFKHYHDVFPVTQEGQLTGSISITSVKRLPQSRWDTTTVAEVMEPVSTQTTIDVQADVADALTKMKRANLTRLVVTDAGQLTGMVALKDILKLITLRSDFSSAS